MSFSGKLRAAQARANSWLCIGLDTDVERIPASLRDGVNPVATFNRAIIDATQDIACAYKPNLAFYLAQASAGVDALAQTLAAIPPEIPIILDAKFGDIDSSARGYARFAFELLKVDAVTVSPYLGSDALSPFLEFQARAIFVLVHTSNPGASQLQDEQINDEPVYLRVARLAGQVQGKGEIGLVVGATFPEQLRLVRQANPGAIFLVPGVGAQGGSLAETVTFGLNDAGVGPIINSSRSILYASGESDFAEAARATALKMRDEINALRLPGT